MIACSCLSPFFSSLIVAASMETRGLMIGSVFSFTLPNSVTEQVCVRSGSVLPF